MGLELGSNPHIWIRPGPWPQPWTPVFHRMSVSGAAPGSVVSHDLIHRQSQKICGVCGVCGWCSHQAASCSSLTCPGGARPPVAQCPALHLPCPCVCLFCIPQQPRVREEPRLTKTFMCINRRSLQSPSTHTSTVYLFDQGINC